MAKLDAAIDRLFKEGSGELFIETGGGILLRANGGTQPIVSRKLTTAQIVQAVMEIAPPGAVAELDRDGGGSFAYSAPAGKVEVQFENTDGTARATLKLPARIGAPSRAPIELSDDSSAGMGDSMELASPADMLGLAASAAGLSQPPEPPLPPPPAHAAGSTVDDFFGAPAPEPRRTAAPASSPRVASGALQSLLSWMLQKGASDLHLSSLSPPMVRIDGDISAIPGQTPLQPDRLQEMLWSIAPERNRQEWTERKDTDFAHETEAARFRVNIFEDRKGIGAVLRQIPTQIRTAEEMGLSKAVLDLCYLAKGLVLVTGPTGSGKSTTLATMIDYINRNREDHIITIEDPIEFVHPNKKCLVNQREVGTHTGSFKHALRAALREDPDIVLVGEMRDLETIAIALETAETGHLVFGTLHTNTAPSTVDRIIDQFPPDRQEQIRVMLSESLKAVISQTLCKKVGGGRVAAHEILLCASGVANLIREGKTFQIPSIMQTSRGQGMCTMNDALLELVKRKLVEPKEAWARAQAKSELKASMERAGFKVEVGAEA